MSAKTIKGIEKLIELGFTLTNISSTLNGSGAKAPEAIAALTSKETIKGIEKLIELGFTPTNISSILNGSGKKAPQAIRELMSAKTIKGIEKLIELGFTLTNISSILNRSGVNASEIVEKLIANKDILRVLLIEKAPAEISSSSALHSIGKPEKVMPALEEIRDTALDELIESTPGNTIAPVKQR
jgi:molybdenum cofactor biosynthesis enzyme MoaA